MFEMAANRYCVCRASRLLLPHAGAGKGAPTTRLTPITNIFENKLQKDACTAHWCNSVMKCIHRTTRVADLFAMPRHEESAIFESMKPPPRLEVARCR